jgi:hypothetical protein
MEKYFVLLAFAAYVDEEDGGATGRTFAAWLQVCSGNLLLQPRECCGY